MRLSRFAREHYKLVITTTNSAGDPIDAADWEASFDGGETWHACTVITVGDEDQSAWLVAGENVGPGSGAVAVLTKSVVPLVRATAEPEILVNDLDDVPSITLF